jgi:hypothetical protein
MSRGKQRLFRCAGFLACAIAARGVAITSVLLAGLEAGTSIFRGAGFDSCRSAVNSAELRDFPSRAPAVRSAIVPYVNRSSCQDRRMPIFMNPSSEA